MENVHSILLVEDEIKLGKAIQDELVRQGYEVEVATNGKEAEKMFKKQAFSLVLLDINLPYKDGFALCREFRKHNQKVPIVMLTAAGQISDKVTAFELGADDYIVKPFHFDELFARIKVFLKRSEKPRKAEKIVVHDLVIDLWDKSVKRNGTDISLTAKEFTLLVLLASNKEKVISKQEILSKVWDMSFDTGTNTIEVYISFLRNKIDKPFEQKLIYTKPGFGYYIK
ncbi:DNA-binding response regulator, OmpR family, contains REC and winged-helix (wHTH) domain [Hydrobacter penzbergensis]|jgi:two-component system copper resistance phosphate regulon response regulator CusR|uniref:DNA-binding response regulator, OmpR family, contains REC and winged-helix (WHTH) domain n=1 Tax=Hydrobacter penzbergensis TaxID=1235997 RepID=A0A8X8LCV9_9BACT|nr:response regulator transcription factor [Hydrobacter penzbergensis]MBN8720822.1 response regulator transcription factor [Sediminibacterium magnilacihabitans]PQV58174.1 DNA-binding response OmpR family regulator [Sediminibacterium magnilacihabitans]SDX61424.1 DNA-binding response regulator, OmpR family, contains REC and winged-helix (wHTH) domain [Hydrobacter penzbergensis]